MTNPLTSLAAIVVSILVAAGIAYAGGQNSVLLLGFPLFALCGLIAFVIQWCCFVPAFLLKTEHFFDLIGSLTYITLALLVMFLRQGEDPRTILIGSLVLVWALRLGSFLFMRIRRDGHDGRFDDIKPDFPKFLMTWTLQGLWVFITFAAGLAAMTANSSKPMGVFAFLGAIFWVIGFSIEVVADWQKRRFRAQASNVGQFIQTGLWSWSRHPNYFGEILLWVGIALIAFPVLSGMQYFTLVSPVFVFLLLTQVSGVRMLEARAAKKWGSDPDYQAYCARTPALMIRPW